MKRALVVALVALRVCWGPRVDECGEFVGRLKLPTGASKIIVEFYVVRLAGGELTLVEPELIEAINPKGR